jgi:hypothetical protein
LLINLAIVLFMVFYLYLIQCLIYRSFTSFFLQKLIVYGLNSKIALIIQHLTQAGLFIFSPYIILKENWCSSHAAFVILQACVHFMKMHSYTTVNRYIFLLIIYRDYREDYLSSSKNKTDSSTNYPTNINAKEFVLFMFTPWLVYAPYPRRSTVSWYYAL